ncbi:MAG: ABC transporter ATP-binding protein [Magnetococcales bacterium]|nr:ABC transporter ATP-binding protein [Magnetococcales bacterium]MBF0115807.1 ABC transporter ATP-binding protein [Magnetococcales bacterium]
MNGQVAIALQEVGHCYASGPWILRQLSAQVIEGQICAVLGPNGRGKSTLIHIILGLLSPREGHVRLQGRAGFVPQLFLPTFPYRVLDMVLMGRAAQVGVLSVPGRHDTDMAMAALSEVGMEALAERPFSELSGGQRQMVMLARALASEEKILILDEPASSLDLRNQLRLLRLLRRLADKRHLTILFTTHQPQHAMEAADVALLLMDREVPPVLGVVAEVMTEENMTRLYGIAMQRIRLAHAGGECFHFLPRCGDALRVGPENG